MEYNNIIDNYLKEHGDPETEKFVDLSLDFVDEIHSILEAKGMSQKDLSKKMGKSQAEVSKWLSGSHNMTFKSMAKLSVALEEDIIMTTSKAKKIFAGKNKDVVFVTVVHKKPENHFKTTQGYYTSDNEQLIEYTSNDNSGYKKSASYGC